MTINGGTLIFEGGNTNNAGGTIEAQAGSTVEITDGAVVTGGTIDVIDTGTVRLDVATVQGGATNVGATGSVLVAGDSTLSGVYNSVAGGQLTVINNFELTLDGNGSYNNAGDMLVNSFGSNTDIMIDGSAGDVTLSGGGTVTLNDTANLERARIRGTNNGVLVNENNTIQGEGRLGVGTLEIVNQADGIIGANVFAQYLLFPRMLQE